MIRLALLTENDLARAAIAQMTEEGRNLELVYRGRSSDQTGQLIRGITAADPEAILLDVNNRQDASALIVKLRKASRAPLVGFCLSRLSEEQRIFEETGLSHLLQEPFSSAELETAVNVAIHERNPISHANIIAFLPAKAGSGCSTVALNTAASLANGLNKRTLLLEADICSGALSILLGVQKHKGVAEILATPSGFTGTEISGHLVSIGKLDLLLANPFRRHPAPTWANYYHLLLSLQGRYDFVFIDLADLIDSATSELLKAARCVFIVCQPELATLMLGQVRREDLENNGIPPEKILALGNRWEPDRLKRGQLVGTIEAPMFAALPNDYEEINSAALESRLVRRESPFGRACADLARRLSGSPPAAPDGPVSRVLRLILSGSTKGPSSSSANQ